MNKEKTNLQKVKDFFANTPELENLEVIEKESKEVKDKFEEVTLADGVTVVMIEPAVEVDASVMVMSEEGVSVPMPIGEYELADGKVIVIAVEGVIADVKEVGTDDEVPVEEEELAKDKPTAEEQRVRKVIESTVKESVFELTERLNKFEKENEFLHKENDALKVLFAELKENTGVALKEVFEQPTKEPVVKKKNVFKKEDKNIFIKTKK